MAVEDAAWAEARRLYGEGMSSLAEIADATGISVGRIRRRAMAEGWVRAARAQTGSRGSRSGRREGGMPRPSGRAGDARLGAATHGAAREAGSASAARAVVVQRLYRAIDTKLKRLEARMRSGKSLSAADSERETRELGTMVRSFEKVTELAAEIDRSKSKTDASRSDVSAADAERMRREIAERIERLVEARNAR